MWALSLGYQSCELSFSGTSEVLTRTISMVFKGAATHRLAGSAAPGVRPVPVRLVGSTVDNQ
jgi:hypothetical protein